MNKPHQDPELASEQAKYENPIPSRTYLLSLFEASSAPLSYDEVKAQLDLQGEDQSIALKRRLRAMERDGQLVFNRSKKYALPERLNLIKGTVIAHREGFGFVRPETASGKGEDLFLHDRQMATVLHGDKVLVQEVGTDRKGRKEARVVRVVEERNPEIVGRYFVENGMGFVVADDTRINQDILIPPEDKLGARHGQIVVCQITTRPTQRFNAMGKVIEVLGEHMAPGMEIEIALRNYDIPHEWPKDVKRQIKKVGEEVPEEAKADRVDLRDLPLVTIDGEDARDFDDAVYCEKKRSGGWRLWVAIADVSYYVRPDTALDNEAQNRGNSVYFPNQVIPMLPEKLSNGLCSLNPQVDRLCMVCEMTVSAKGQLSGYKFYEAVMKSHARFTYNKVAAILDGDDKLNEQYATQVPHLQELHRLYCALKGARQQRGAIEFETVESRFIFNAQRKIEEIVPVERNDAHKMIEECMILANVASARFVGKHKEPALYRVHQSPGQERLQNFRRFIGELGLNLSGDDKPTPSDFGALVSQIEGRPDQELIQTMLLRSMQQAIYDADNEGHFGLALAAYSHFTSPIRRYPDLLLHRALKYLVAKETHGDQKQRWTPTGGYHYQTEEMDLFGPQCSMTERRADDATRDVDAFLKCEYMQDHVGDELFGVISSVNSFGFFVRLNDLLIDGLVHVSTLKNDYYQFDQVHHQLIGENSHTRYRLGDTVCVKVVGVNLEDRKIDFELAGENATANKGRSGSGRNSSGKGRGKSGGAGRNKAGASRGKSGGKAVSERDKMKAGIVAPSKKGKAGGRGKKGKNSGMSAAQRSAAAALGGGKAKKKPAKKKRK
ncbi:ribonuclease R [Corallincola luteus]|uniref:Ribonuclease R n=1 Tax=Corallincola luteus TaxID=1775177 RepID=A0ABY2ARV1_9GAMM|nr:ribonuclease R [Corallincola luteus]TCI04672.1 ribonuclease R [Corallincola luteus]